ENSTDGKCKQAEVQGRAGDVPGGSTVALFDEIVSKDRDKRGRKRTTGDDAEDSIRQCEGIDEGIGLVGGTKRIGEVRGACQAKDAAKYQRNGDDGGGASKVACTQRSHLH